MDSDVCFLILQPGKVYSPPQMSPSLPTFPQAALLDSDLAHFVFRLNTSPPSDPFSTQRLKHCSAPAVVLVSVSVFPWLSTVNSTAGHSLSLRSEPSRLHS